MGKALKLYVVIQKSLEIYLKRNLNWIWEKFITSQCSLKKPQGSFSGSFL